MVVSASISLCVGVCVCGRCRFGGEHVYFVSVCVCLGNYNELPEVELDSYGFPKDPPYKAEAYSSFLG